MPCQVIGNTIVCGRSHQRPTDKAGPGYVIGICRLATRKGLDDDALFDLVRRVTGKPWDPDRLKCGAAWEILRALKKLPDPSQGQLF